GTLCPRTVSHWNHSRGGQLLSTIRSTGRKGTPPALLRTSMFRNFHLLAVLALAAPLVPAATLQQLSMDQMTDLATSVVRARVTGVSAAISTASGTPTIYTHYRLQ